MWSRKRIRDKEIQSRRYIGIPERKNEEEEILNKISNIS